MGSIGERLTAAFTARGCRIAFAGVERLGEVRATLAALRQSGALDPEFAGRSLDHFEHEPPEDFRSGVSLVVVASPQPPTRLVFARSGGKAPLETVIPPTYVDRPVREACQEALGKVLTPAGYSFRRAVVPVKTLAARTGLGKYGRNNVLYFEDCGSFVRLDVYYLDAPVPESSWGEPEPLDRCRACRGCQKACPTGAIPADRFLVRAERCLTDLNEYPGDFPAWVAPTAHNAIVGCLRCQVACPENRPFLGQQEETVEFTAVETALLEEDAPWDDLPEPLQAKLTATCLEGYLPLLPRNLRALSAQPAGACG